MRISDWSSDVCSSDLIDRGQRVSEQLRVMVLPPGDLDMLLVGGGRVLAAVDVFPLPAIEKVEPLLTVGEPGGDVVEPVCRIGATVRRHLNGQSRRVWRAIGDVLAEAVDSDLDAALQGNGFGILVNDRVADVSPGAISVDLRLREDRAVVGTAAGLVQNAIQREIGRAHV